MGKMKRTEGRGVLAGIRVMLVSLVLFFCIAFFLNLLYSLPLRDSILWYVTVFVYLYIPGCLLLRCLGFNKEEFFVTLFHSLALGSAFTPLVYIVLRRISLSDMLYPFGLGMSLIWLYFVIRDFKKRELHLHTSAGDMLSVLILLVMVVSFLHFSHFTDVVLFEGGYKFRTNGFTETLFHLGIINALKDMFPPVFPYASGHDFSYYHLNMHFEIEMFNRISSLDTVKLTFFYFPLLYFCLLVFIPYMMVRLAGGGRLIGVLTGMLMFGSDLSFLPGVLRMVSEGFPWTAIFKTTIWSLLTLNGYLAALPLMFLSIIYLSKFYEKGKASHLLVFAVLGYSAFGFKSSVGLHIAGAALVTGVISLAATVKRREGLLICAASLLSILAMAIDMILSREGIGSTVTGVDPFNGFRYSLMKLHLAAVPSAFYVLLFPLYVVGLLGARAFGLSVIKDVFRRKSFDLPIVFLLIFVISGMFLSEMVYIGPPTREINNAGWFSSQALMAGWLLLPYFLMNLQFRRRHFWGAVSLVVLLSFPSTAQFLALRSDNQYSTVDASAAGVVTYLQQTPPPSVILHPLNTGDPSLASQLAGRQSVISVFRSFVTDYVNIEECDDRARDVITFFDPKIPSNVFERSSILERYKVNYVYAPLAYSEILDREPALSEVFRNSGYVIYKVKNK